MFEADVTEAECLSDILDGINETLIYVSTRSQSAYNINKLAKVGDTCRCPYCNKAFIKKTYQQVFCAPVKTRKGKKYICKDKFWNTDYTRIDRTVYYMH